MTSHVHCSVVVALTVACPECGVPRGSLCSFPFGRPNDVPDAGESHARREAAAQAPMRRPRTAGATP
jgi:hypothetical protein